MTPVFVENLYTGALRGVQLRLDAGLHVVLGDAEDGSADLARALVGVAKPRRGRVELGGQDPRRSPTLRRRIASLLAVEPALGRTPVQELPRELGRSENAGASYPTLELVGAAGLTAAPHDSLSAAERRAVALALALDHPDPQLVVLHEPLGAAANGDPARVGDQIRTRAQKVTTIVLTASALHAHALGGTLHLLRRGLILGTTPAAHALGGARAGFQSAELTLMVSKPKIATTRLVASQVVRGVEFDERSGRIVIRGDALEPLAQAVALICREAPMDLLLLVPRRMSLQDLQHATRGTEQVPPRASEPRIAETSAVEPPSVEDPHG